MIVATRLWAVVRQFYVYELLKWTQKTQVLEKPLLLLTVDALHSHLAFGTQGPLSLSELTSRNSSGGVPFVTPSLGTRNIPRKTSSEYKWNAP